MGTLLIFFSDIYALAAFGATHDVSFFVFLYYYSAQYNCPEAKRFLLSATLFFLAVVSFVIYLRFFCDRRSIAKKLFPPPACHFLASRFLRLLFFLNFQISKFGRAKFTL